MNITAKPEQTIVMDRAAPGAAALPDDALRLPAEEERTLETEFRQQKRLRREERSFRLFNRRFLEVEYHGRRHTRLGVCNLAFLDPEPASRTTIPGNWILALLLVLAGGATTVLAGHVLPGVALLAAAVLLAVQVATRLSFELVFRSRTGRAAVFSLDWNPVQRRHAREFAELLGARILRAGQALPDGRDGLRLEMAEHRRLLESGLIRQGDYEQARRLIMARFNQLHSRSRDTAGRSGH